MARFIALVFASLLVTVGGASASTTAHSPRQAIGQRHGWMARDANPKHAWLYVAGYANNLVAIYDLSKRGIPKIGQISDGLSGPAGLSLDAGGNLAVSNYNNASVTIYAAGATTPSLTLTQGITQTVSVTFDASSNVWVSNVGNPSDILVFSPGQTTPSEMITSSLIQHPGQLIFDNLGNAYYADTSTGISEIPVGSQQPQSLNLQGLNEPSGLALNPSTGELFVGNLAGGNRKESKVIAFPPGAIQPSRSLQNTPFTDYLTTGKVGRATYLVVPDSQSVVVGFFRMSHKSAAFSVNTVQDAHGVAIKPAGIP